MGNRKGLCMMYKEVYKSGEKRMAGNVVAPLELDWEELTRELKQRGWQPARLLAFLFLSTSPAETQQRIALSLADAWQAVQNRRQDKAVMDGVWESLKSLPPRTETERPPSRHVNSSAFPDSPTREMPRS